MDANLLAQSHRSVTEFINLKRTLFNRTVLGKPIIEQMVKTFPTFYRINMINTVFKRIGTGLYPKSDACSQGSHSIVSSNHFEI
jgi:hypothetical protein